MKRWYVWSGFVIPLVLALLAGCSGPTRSGNEPGVPIVRSPEVTIQVPQTIPEDQLTRIDQAPSPASAEPTAAPAAVEPRGKVTYVWHTAITPQWFDPLENTSAITPYAFQYALHDAVVKHMPGKPLSPSLAESYEIAPDFKSATFKLRPNITFHDGSPVTAEDVRFTFESYKGANASVLHDKTERIETPDARTVKFVFKEPFLDFLLLYGTPATGAGWVVPKKYYEQVGPDGFKQHPIGAGPYKFARQSGGTHFEFEAFTEYWRKTPNVKTLVFRAAPEGATRVAAMQTGEADLMNLVPGQLIDVVKQDRNLQIAPVHTAPFWIEFPGYEEPASPFHDKRVREAVSLALNRQAIGQAEEGGYSALDGNFIPENWPGAIGRPTPAFDLARAKQLLAEAGFPNGFDAGHISPLPNYFSLGERVISSLRQIGIEAQLNQMERGAFFAKLGQPGAFPSGLVINISGAPGDAAARIRSFALCPPKGASSQICDPAIDEKFARYEASTDEQERDRLSAEIQSYLLDNFLFVPIYRQAFINVKGPRIANPWEEIIGAIPQYVYVGPYEDLRLRG